MLIKKIKKLFNSLIREPTMQMSKQSETIIKAKRMNQVQQLQKLHWMLFLNWKQENAKQLWYSSWLKRHGKTHTHTQFTHENTKQSKGKENGFKHEENHGNSSLCSLFIPCKSPHKQTNKRIKWMETNYILCTHLI